MSRAPMRCPRCRVEMNHHADTLDEEAVAESPGEIGRALGGVVVAVYTCPECGEIATRRAS